MDDGAAPLRALVLTDGVAGHDRINLGVLAALGRLARVEARWLGVRETGSRSRGFDRIAGRFAPFERFFHARYDIEDAEADRLGPAEGARFDVVVSAGPSTGAANIALARHAGGRSIFFGFPKLPLVPEFDVLLRPDRPAVRLGRGVTVLRPSEIDPDALPRPRRGGEARTMAALIGGDTKHYAFTAKDFALLAEGLRRAGARGVTVTAFNSRRTPAAHFDAFVAAFAPDGVTRRVVDFRREGFRSNLQAYAADVVVATADSMSMIAEALAARRPTLMARPAGYRPPARDVAELAEHVQAGVAAFVGFDEFAFDHWLDRAAELRELPYHPLARLAEAVRPAIRRAGAR
ncbi:ELM1/GtrOC1 family putative glycosyltransferase [Methylopila henanensis]|uniref:ELM1/GtrOC1 family putative glycosyltransferase n=1 Tax=Methylopila henanensis TaxID=873516 RepID=A0ABW4K248_9HYPH